MSILGKFRRLLKPEPSVFGATVASASPLEDAVLGSLIPSKAHPDTLVGTVPYLGCALDIQISRDGGTIGDALKLASSAVVSLAEIDARCRQLIAADSLGGYNTDWRFGQTALPDGIFENFEKPALSEAEFSEKLKLVNLEASGAACLTLSYDDDDMFWGHSLIVTSFDGVNLGDVHVSMFG